MVLVERDGSARAFPVDMVDGKTLKGQIAVYVAKEAVVMTDDFHFLQRPCLSKSHGMKPSRTAGEYARLAENGVSVNTNTAESFFALLKRGHYGTFHGYPKSIFTATATNLASGGRNGR